MSLGESGYWKYVWRFVIPTVAELVDFFAQPVDSAFMIESIWITRLGLGIDVVGALLIALDLFQTRESFGRFNKWVFSLQLQLGQKSATLRKAGEHEWEQSSEGFPAWSTMIREFLRSMSFITVAIFTWALFFVTRTLDRPRRLGVLFIIFGFTLQIVATFMTPLTK